MCEQPAASRGWLIPSYLVFSTLLRLRFGGGLLTAAEFGVLFQHYWLQADRQVKESHLILQQTHTPTHTTSPECVCVCLLNPPHPHPPGSPIDRIPDCNPSVRPGRKVSASMKLFIHQSPAHFCMYEFIDSDYFIVSKFPLTSSHTSKFVQNCNNEWVRAAHKSPQLWFKIKCRLLAIRPS